MSEVGGGREETPRVQGQGGGWEELPRVRGQWRPGGDIPRPRSGAARRSYLAPEARASGRKEQPEEWWLRSTGGPRGAIPPSRSGTVAVRRNPSSKVKNSGCALLEQP